MRKHMLGAETPKRGWCAPLSAPKSAERVAKQATTSKREREGGASVVYFPTWKGGRRMVNLRHYFHYEMACLLEMDPEVLWWSADRESVEVGYEGGELAEFKSNLVAKTRAGLRLVKLHDDSYRRRDKAVPVCRANPKMPFGVECETLTRSEVMAHPRLAASQDILFYRPFEWEPELAFRLAASDAMHPVQSLGDMHKRLGEDEVPWSHVLSMVAQGFVEVDMDDEVGPAIKVLSCKHEGHLG